MTVMAQKGYAGASIAEIATVADLNHGLVHYYFGSKLEVLLLVIDIMAEQQQERLQSVEENHDDPWSCLLALLDVHVGVGASADPVALACWSEIGAEAIRQEVVREKVGLMLAHTVQVLEGQIVRGSEMGMFTSKLAPAEAAAALTAAIWGYFQLAATARELIPRGSAVRATSAMARGLLHPHI
jgi:TetR/AcrR family transcriptional regulator, transcriptional repressor of bet genes